MAKVFLESGDSWIIANDGADVFGAAGDEQVIINAGVTGVTLDSNVERADLAGNVADYTFQQQGNQLVAFSGGEAVMYLPVQEDGSQVVFADGSVELTLDATGMQLGGSEVPSTEGAVVPVTIDDTVTSEAGDGGSAPDEGETFTLTEALAAETLPAGYVLSDATADLGALAIADVAAAQAAAAAVVAGAANAAELELAATYTIADTLANVLAADAAVLAAAGSYSLTDAAGALGELTEAQVAVVLGAANAADFTYTAAFTLTKGLEDLDAANTAKADFLAEVDGDDNAGTSWTEVQVATALTTAETATNNAVVAISAESTTDDIAYTGTTYSDASEAVQAAIIADTQTGAAALLAAAEEALAEAQADVDAVAGLAAAQASVDAAQDVADAADKAETLAGNAYAAASTDFVSLNSGVTDTLNSAAGTGTYVLTAGPVTLIEYDAETEAFVLAADITEEDYEGVTAVLNAVNADAAAIVASKAADEALLNAQLERNYLDLDATGEADLEAIANAFHVTELGTDEMPTLAEIQTEISILEGLRDALHTAIGEIAFTTDEATTEGLLTSLTTAAVTDGILSAADKTAIDGAFTTAQGVDGSTTAAAITAAQGALATDNTLDRAATGLQALVDAFVDFTDATLGTSATNDLTSDLTIAQNAITNIGGTGIQDLIDDLNEALANEAEAQANVDTLADLNDAIDAAEQAFEDNGFAVPTTIDAANEYATSGDDVFVLGTVPGNAANVLNFGLLGDDKIFIGTDYVLNEGALATDGDNSVLEVFLTEVSGNATITVEQEAFGSNSGDPETVITLTGVALEDITFADGFISLV